MPDLQLWLGAFSSIGVPLKVRKKSKQEAFIHMRQKPSKPNPTEICDWLGSGWAGPLACRGLVRYFSPVD